MTGLSMSFIADSDARLGAPASLPACSKSPLWPAGMPELPGACLIAIFIGSMLAVRWECNETEAFSQLHNGRGRTADLQFSAGDFGNFLTVRIQIFLVEFGRIDPQIVSGIGGGMGRLIMKTSLRSCWRASAPTRKERDGGGGPGYPGRRSCLACPWAGMVLPLWGGRWSFDESISERACHGLFCSICYFCKDRNNRSTINRKDI